MTSKPKGPPAPTPLWLQSISLPLKWEELDVSQLNPSQQKWMKAVYHEQTDDFSILGESSPEDVARLFFSCQEARYGLTIFHIIGRKISFNS